MFDNSVRLECDGECWAATGWGDHTIRYRRAPNVSVDSAAAGACDPRGRLVSAHWGQLLAPKKPAQVLFWSRRRRRPAYPGPGQGLTPSGYDRRSGSSRLDRRCLPTWGLVAGVRADVSLRAVLRSSSATTQPPSNLLTISIRIKVPQPSH